MSISLSNDQLKEIAATPLNERQGMSGMVEMARELLELRAQLSAANARLAELERDRDEMKRQRDMLLNSDRAKAMDSLKSELQALRVENERLKAPIEMSNESKQ